jgi:exosortase E/protease (VPEID-CTERM system)
VLAAVLIAELLVLTVSVDGAALAGQPGLAGLIGQSGAWILRGLIGFVASFVAFAGLRGSLEWVDLKAELGQGNANWLAAGLHVVAVAIFALLTASLYGGGLGGRSDWLAAAWLVTGVLAMVSATLAAIPLAFWRTLARRTGPTWVYALGVALLTTAFTALSRSLWQWTAQLTFRLVAFILLPLYPNLIQQPERLRLRAPNFGVIIDQACSGLEGAGLMLVFVIFWLAISRRDFRFPRALLLVPAAVGVLYLLNAVRIALLVIIGNAGAREIALGGFHSQAGWIAFNGVALGMTLVVPRFDWFRTAPRAAIESSAGGQGWHWLRDTPTAVYLLPFLAILASGMVSRAVSAHFEWLYALRLAAASGVLWMLRPHWKRLDWRFGWQAVAAGVAVFALWLGLDAAAGTPVSPMPAELASASALGAGLWIALRAFAAVLSVPVAEELAFRGFLMRRLNSPEFETVPFTQVTWAGVALSSVAFGLLHGDRWLAGIAAGVLYALVARRTGRLGESVAAHSITNGLLALYVLATGNWQYW